MAAVTRVYRKAIDDAVAQRESTVTERDRYALEMTFSRGLSTGWLEGTNHPYLTHGKFGKKRGAFVGNITSLGRNFIELDWSGTTGLDTGDGIVFDAGEDRNLEQGGRIFRVDGKRVKFHEKHTNIDWKRVRVGQGVWKTDDPKLNAEVKALWKNVKLSPNKETLHLVVSGAAGGVMTLSCGDIVVTSEEKLEVAQNRPMGLEVLEKQFSRLGDTVYQLGSVKNELSGEVMMPMSALNRLRRSLVTKLDYAAEEAETAKNDTYEVSKNRLSDLMPDMGEEKDVEQELSVMTRHPHQVEAALEAGIKRIYADYEDIRRYKDAVKIVRDFGQDATIHLATPRIQKPSETGYFKYIDKAEADGVLIRNLGAIEYFKEREDFYRTGDFSLNCANPITAKILKERGGLVAFVRAFQQKRVFQKRQALVEHGGRNLVALGPQLAKGQRAVSQLPYDAQHPFLTQHIKQGHHGARGFGQFRHNLSSKWSLALRKA